MAYGTIKVDNITFDNGGVDKLITVSGLFYSTSGALTVTGAISGGSVTAPTATFTTLTGTTTAGTTATFTSGSFTSLTGVTTTVTSGIFALGSAAAPAITISGDLNTGIYSPGADQLAIATAGTQRLLVDSAGGVTVPTRFIIGQVNNVGGLSEATRTSSGIFNTSRLLDGGTNPYLQTGAEAGIVYFNADGSSAPATVFRVGGTEKFRIDSSGNLGLGVVPVSSQGRSLQITAGVLEHESINTNDLRTNLTSNAISVTPYSSTYKYLATGASATMLQQGTGQFRFYNAPTGTAGNTISFTQAMTLDASGRLGLGTTDMYGTLNVQRNTSAQYSTLSLGDFATATNSVGIYGRVSSSGIFGISTAGAPIVFYNTGSGTGEAARIDSSGRLLVGTSSARTNLPFNFGNTAARLQVEGIAEGQGAFAVIQNYASATTGVPAVFNLARSGATSINSNTIIASGNQLGEIQFSGADGTNFVRAASIRGEVDGTPGADDMPGRLVFSTTADGAASPTEAMRITSGGNVMISSTAYTTARLGIGGYANGDRLGVYMRASTDPATPFDFRNAANTTVGSIATTASATAFNTSSDYRLKENIVAVADGIPRLLQLKPSRLNFIAEPGKTVDGFLAHEAQAVVPECVTGEKDAVDEDGNPIYQGIDQSKMVPLVVAALQECIKKVEALESELALLKSKP